MFDLCCPMTRAPDMDRSVGIKTSEIYCIETPIGIVVWIVVALSWVSGSDQVNLLLCMAG